MARSTQLFSCSMRSGVQVPVEAGMRGDAGAMSAGSGSTGAVRAIDGIGDEITPDGAIDGDMTMASLNAAAVWAADRALSARNGQPRESETSKRKSMCGLRADPEIDSPDVTLCRWQPVRRK